MSRSRMVEKPWGYEEIWAQSQAYVGKLLFIREGHRLSLQHHRVKHETIRVMQGRLELSLGPAVDDLSVLIMVAGDVQVIEPGWVHRMRAIEDVLLAEVSTPELDDVVRHEDDYGRA